MSNIELDNFVLDIWPKADDPPFLQNCTVDSPGPLSKVADHAAQNDAEHVAVRFSPGGHHAAVRAYAWALDGSDAATFELTSAGQPVRTAEAPPTLASAKPAASREDQS